MSVRTQKVRKHRSKSVSGNFATEERRDRPNARISDNRSITATQTRVQAMADGSSMTRSALPGLSSSSNETKHPIQKMDTLGSANLNLGKLIPELQAQRSQTIDSAIQSTMNEIKQKAEQLNSGSLSKEDSQRIAAGLELDKVKLQGLTSKRNQTLEMSTSVVKKVTRMISSIIKKLR